MPYCLVTSLGYFVYNLKHRQKSSYSTNNASKHQAYQSTKITSLSLIFLKIWINIKEPKSANTEAMIAWVKKDAPAKNIKEISMPN